MMSRSLVISAKASAAIIATELVLVLLFAWIYAGMPNFTRDIGPASVTLQFAPPPHPPLARSHQI